MFSATAIANFLACQHIATLDRAESRKEIKKPFFKDPTVDLLRQLGLEHEQQYLRQLAGKDGLAIVQIDVSSTWENAAAETVEALRRGADAVYQATFLEVLGADARTFCSGLTSPALWAVGPTRL